ncbi:hypothetical protein [Flavimaricola marinus]|uniref:Uncharacterized protein n=1 Tax=Flavimaricola marinus TaxID=1819565 RepID=A0A238LFF2_9RHOB|nr:hypothetical protein [Flavimaricola marinus]SMY07676.1 hypothetical protein LOM8899_01815 [Flavimaricola marinus]
MIQLFIPFVIGLAIGIEPPEKSMPMAQAGTDEMVTPEATAAPQVTLPGQALADEYANREPEPQMATGKFTTAIEIKQIMLMTKGSWVAINDNDGQDILYFTHLLAWRCGMWAIRYGLNGEPANTELPLEECHEDTTSPNAMTDMDNFPPYVFLPHNSIESVYVEIVFDDGTTDFAVFPRASVLLP